MNNEYACPLIGKFIDDTICYDIQMVTGNMICKSILDDYGFYIGTEQVTKERAARYCENCLFNQMHGPLTKFSGPESVLRIIV